MSGNEWRRVAASNGEQQRSAVERAAVERAAVRAKKQCIVATNSTNHYRCLPSHYRGAACLLVHLCSPLFVHVKLARRIIRCNDKTAMRHMNTSHRITTHNPPILYRPTGSTRHTEPTVRSIAMHPRSLVAPSFTKMSRNLNFFRRFESTKATRRRREACCSTCKIVA